MPGTTRTFLHRALALVTTFGLVAVVTVPINGDPRRRPELSRVGVPSDVIARHLAAASLVRIPLHFEANEGQTDPAVRFLARGRGFSLFLTATEAVLALRQQQSSRVVRMTLVGANPAAEVSGEGALPGRVNYFVGNDPKHWRSNIPTFARVRYPAVYPGVDLVYYGNQRDLEYDLIVAPGADPGAIGLGFTGVDTLQVDGQGDLVLRMAGGQVHLRRPEVYQELGGVRTAVSGGYTLKGQHQVGFWIGAYDASRPLIIDPVLSFSTFLGGSSSDIGYDIAVDALRNVYVAGDTVSADFPTTMGAVDTTANGSNDVFVTKLNAAGSALVYSTYVGGSGSDHGDGLAIDAAGNAYVTGWTASADYPTTGGAFDTTSNGGLDAFVTKVNPAGSALVYSTYLGGALDDLGRGIAVDTSGSTYITGDTVSVDFPTTVGALDTTANGSTDAFVTKVNAAGSALSYSTYVGGSGFEEGWGIAVDTTGAAYVTGQTLSANFPTTVGAFDTTLASSDAFVTKLNAAGSGLVYSTFLGGTASEFGYAIAWHAAGEVAVAGDTTSINFPVTAGAFDTTFNGGTGDAFVTRLNAAGSALVCSTYLGGSAFDTARGIAMDSAGNAFVTGWTISADFPTMNAFQPAYGGGPADAFVTKVTATGFALAYSTYLGGSANDNGTAIASDTVGNAYVTGPTSSANFPTTPGAFDPTANGSTDAFIARIGTPTTIGLYNPGSSVFYLKNSNTGGAADVAFGYGPGGLGWTPLSGDWDGNGTTTPGLYDPVTGTFYLKNTNAGGAADIAFSYGPGGLLWMPVVGDWDGNGTDTVGVYDPTTSVFYLRNTNTAGPADLAFGYGPPGAGWTPLAGDWDGDGASTVGLYNGAAGVFFLRNTNAGGPADLAFGYGPAGLGWAPVVGDWDGNGTATVGLHNGTAGTFYLKNTNAGGPADLTFGYGPGGAGWMPLAGDWDGL